MSTAEVVSLGRRIEVQEVGSDPGSIGWPVGPGGEGGGRIWNDEAGWRSRLSGLRRRSFSGYRWFLLRRRWSVRSSAGQSGRGSHGVDDRAERAGGGDSDCFDSPRSRHLSGVPSERPSIRSERCRASSPTTQLAAALIKNVTVPLPVLPVLSCTAVITA